MLLKALTFFIVAFVFGCTGNFLRELADKNADDALLFDAKTAVNAEDYDTAIDILTNQMSSSAQQGEEARETLSGAYAGKCGLNFFEFVDGLAQATSGSAFVLASTPFVGTTADSSYCLLALQTLDLIGPTEVRSTNQNAFASMVGMVLMGSATRLYTDNTPLNGDGISDAPNISCTLTDTQIDEVILGYGYMSKNFSALSGQIGSSSGSTFSDSISTCQSVAGSACEITDVADITAPLRDTMRDLLNTTEYGVGSADGSSPAVIPVACP